ncbi:hypothetical protein [Nocardioides euryhalodurans]|uniref:Galactose oxidase n=1 Tax=Nocardioides euryhalodurans TaxID=2518370 RepID=A0A4P7GGQ4_9ACTN|nr:hypothetical protein [Nocardioides euryhalodurans]QBR91015.1 hypothetical protein EXE57_01070 [Nocardioides euryhalodurans]
MRRSRRPTDVLPLRRRLALASVPLVGLLAGCVQLTAHVGPGSEPVAGWTRSADAPLSGRTDAVVAGVGDELVVVGGWEWSGGDGELVSETWLWRPPA